MNVYRIKNDKKVFYALVYIYFILLITVISGCKDKKKSLTEKREDITFSKTTIQLTDDIVATVRSVVMKQVQELSKKEKSTVLQSTPMTGKYQMAGTFGQYFWSWNLPTQRTIEVRYVGDIKLPIDTEKMVVIISNEQKK